VKVVVGMIVGAAIMVASLVSPAQAAPVLPTGHEFSPIIRVEGGCGEYAHRGRDGYCYRNHEYRDHDQYGYGRACPPGWHLGSEGRRCWRNY